MSQRQRSRPKYSPSISEKPVTDEAAAEFQALLDDMAGEGGMAATVMTADGTWSGAAGTADGIRPVQVDDQFAIGSITKSVIAAQVMQLVDAGELSLDDLAADHLPDDLDFDTNQATIRQLLSHQSGLREPDEFILPTLGTDRLHVWTVAEVLELAGDPGWPAGSRFEYSNANYFVLGLIIEQVRGHPLAQVLREGVLAVDGVERLVYQPDERPSEPMAMPAGESAAALELGGGYLPSIASATGGGPAAAMASDSPSLARWWRAFCAGEIVSAASLTEMATAPLTGTPSLGEDLRTRAVPSGRPLRTGGRARRPRLRVRFVGRLPPRPRRRRRRTDQPRDRRRRRHGPTTRRCTATGLTSTGR